MQQAIKEGSPKIFILFYFIFALAINLPQKIFSKSLIIAYSPLRTQVPSNKNKLLLPIGKLAPYVSVGAITALVSRCRGCSFGKERPLSSGGI